MTAGELPRFRARIVALRESGMSLPAIGRAVGKHHATVYHHLCAVEADGAAVTTPRERAQYLVNRGAGL